MNKPNHLLVIPVLAFLTLLSTPPGYAHSAGAVTLDGGRGVLIQLLLGVAELPGGEAEIGEITLPAGYAGSTEHSHNSTEIFYVLQGQLEQTVGGVSKTLGPGMIGVVPKNQTVVHGVAGDQAVRALIIWLPAGESARLIEKGFKPLIAQ